MPKIAPTAEQYESVRSRVLGYSDAVLLNVKESIAEELNIDSSDADAILANEFQLERCSCCGHWFDKSECKDDDGHGGFECADCSQQ